VPVRVAVGHADPFYPGVQALARVLPRDAVVDFAGGCHDHSFFTAQEPPSLAFLARHLAAGQEPTVSGSITRTLASPASTAG
jgi:hypothetical protein